MKNDDILFVLRCALADLEGSLQVHEQKDWYAHDWKAHSQSIEDVKNAIQNISKK